MPALPTNRDISGLRIGIQVKRGAVWTLVPVVRRVFTMESPLSLHRIGRRFRWEGQVRAYPPWKSSKDVGVLSQCYHQVLSQEAADQCQIIYQLDQLETLRFFKWRRQPDLLHLQQWLLQRKNQDLHCDAIPSRTDAAHPTSSCSVYPAIRTVRLQDQMQVAEQALCGPARPSWV